MAGTASRLTTQSAGRDGGRTRPDTARSMSGLTPTGFGNEPSGLQDVLAFIADFEMEDNASGANHDGDEWMEDDVAAQQQGKEFDSLEELFIDGGRRPSPTTMPSTVVGRHQALMLSASASTSQRSEDVTSAYATKAPRRHRVSRKEELEYLRKIVTEMEDKLQQLKVHAEGGGTPPSAAPATLRDEKAAKQLEQSIALWKKMAERQKSQRELVENENAKLREKLKTQVRMAKSLQRILRKRERAAEQITAEAPKRFKELSQNAHPTGGEFDELVQSLEALYSLTNERIANCPIASGSQPVIREQDVKYNDFTGIFIEFQHSKLLPFNIEAVNRATWRHMSEPGIKYNTYFEESTETSDNMILRKFGVEIKQDHRTARMSARQAVRRYVGSRQIVVVRSSVIDRVEFTDAVTGGLTFRDVGWLVLKDVTGLYSASGPMTLIQSYSTLTPDIDLDSHWEEGSLTDFMLHSREDVEVGNESIVENLLLEEASKRSTAN